MAFRTACGVVVLLATIGASATAHAQEASTEVAVTASVDGPGAAIFLEERLPDDAALADGWRHVCVLPCNVVVTADPVAQHRIVDGRVLTPVFVPRSSTGSRDVHYDPGSSANVPLILGGVAGAGTGVVLGIVGGLKLLSQVTFLGGCDGDRSCEAEAKRAEPARHAEQSQATLLMGVGVALVLVGTVAIIAGAVSGGPPKARASPTAARASSLVDLRF